MSSPLPADVNPPVSGLTPYITGNKHFYRVDTAFTLPKVTTDDWRLKVHGLVDRPFELSWSDLLAMPQVQRTVTLTCVSNPVGGGLAGNAVWQGVLVSDVLARAKPRASADCVYSTSADHFSVATPLKALTDGRDALLAIGMNGSPLPVEHGFPARLVVPGLYGYVSATKWVVDLEVTKFSQVTGYWTPRGWSARGPIKTASRIDTPHHDATVPSQVVPVAGVAWAQTRGISAVEVQVDDGPWQKARLFGVASDETWRQWVFRWDTTQAGSGKHTVRCRAIDGTGAVQVATSAPPAPNGASGYDEVPVTVS
jgi:DMSO/TMAO reductase YedYZ molybdopterin-dependent catalytic subunit